MRTRPRIVFVVRSSSSTLVSSSKEPSGRAGPMAGMALRWIGLEKTLSLETAMSRSWFSSSATAFSTLERSKSGWYSMGRPPWMTRCSWA